MKSRITSNRRGFTLIELLVVIAIIAILAAILFPVFARARENARRTSCSSNLKQIALGMIQYTQDYDEKFPNYNGGTIATGWAGVIQPYMKSTQLLQCPSESTAPSSDPGNTAYTDYAVNLLLGWPSNGVSLAVLTQPTLTVMNSDYIPTADAATTWSAGCTSSACPEGPAKAYFTPGVAQRHLDGMNFVFTDGHVKWYKAQDAITSASVWNYKTPGTTSLSNPTFNLTP